MFEPILPILLNPFLPVNECGLIKVDTNNLANKFGLRVLTPFYFNAAINSLSKRGVPKPVAGSHPLVALNPYLSSSPPRPMALVPNVTSVNASAF